MCSECGSIVRLEGHDEDCLVLEASRMTLDAAVATEKMERAL